MHRFAVVVLMFMPALVSAQENGAAPRAWLTSVGAGLSLTSGNRDTESLNLSFSSSYDPKTDHVFKAEALHIRGEANGERTVDKSAASVRYERTIHDGAFAFAETSYVRDPFKNVEYSVSPVIGAGYHLLETATARLALDGAFGVTFERDEVRGRREKQALKAGEAFEWRISKGTKFTQRVSALWDGRDFGDALYNFESALATTVAKAIELKISYRYDYKTRPAVATLNKGDSALFAALVYKF